LQNVIVLTMRRNSRLSLLACLFESLLVAAPPSEPALYPIKRHAKTGFIDQQGKIVIEPQFDLTLETLGGKAFSENLHPVAKDGKWGYIDRRGAVQIPFQFSQAQQFSEGLAAVRVETVRDGQYTAKYGYIDHSGALRIPAIFDNAGAFSEGLACVGRNYKIGYIDKGGSFVIEPRFDGMSPEWSTFAEGRAGAYQKGAADPQKHLGGAAQDGLWGYIDKTGGWTIPPRYTNISSFHDGLAAVSQEGESGFKYIDYSGQKVLGPFAMAWTFSEGLARVQLMDGGKGAFINPEGKVQFTLDAAFQFVYPFSDGMAQVVSWVQPGGYQRVGYIDRTGALVIPQIYSVRLTLPRWTRLGRPVRSVWLHWKARRTDLGQ
jgi:hypothetical protein